MSQHSIHSIMERFNEDAKQYDPQRRKLIPCFDDFYSISVSLIQTETNKPAILDVGAGTGLLSSLILQKYPKADVTLIDISDKMLEIAKERFKHKRNVHYIVGDYSNYPFDGTYDVVMSALSIHHLTDEEKERFYKRVYHLLNPGGIFINADQVLGETPFLENLYKEDWKNKIEQSGLTKEEIQAAYERTKLDKMSTLKDQMNWLKESGLKDVDCVYKYYNFVILFGRK